MKDAIHDLSTPDSTAGKIKRFINDSTDPLATVRRAQLTAFWNAPRSAHEFSLLSAIERGWRELAHECGRRQLAEGGD